MSPASVEDAIERLDLIIKLLRIANREAISEARLALLGDQVSDEIYDRTVDWRPAGILLAEVIAASGVASRTVHRRLADLVSKGVLETSGAAASLRYRHVPQF
jgi:hypothetical protein